MVERGLEERRVEEGDWRSRGGSVASVLPGDHQVLPMASLGCTRGMDVSVNGLVRNAASPLCSTARQRCTRGALHQGCTRRRGVPCFGTRAPVHMKAHPSCTRGRAGMHARG